MSTRHLSLEQVRDKRRRYRNNKYWRREVEAMLTDEVVDKLLDLEHPTIKSDEHCMYSYVLWCLSNGHSYKAREIIIANT